MLLIGGKIKAAAAANRVQQPNDSTYPVINEVQYIIDADEEEEEEEGARLN